MVILTTTITKQGVNNANEINQQLILYANVITILLYKYRIEIENDIFVLKKCILEQITTIEGNI